MALKSNIIQDDPLYYLDFVQKFVQIKTLNEKVYQGTVFTIDPKSDNVVLISHSEGSPCISVIMGHMIRSIQVCSQPLGPPLESNIADKLFQTSGDSNEVTLSPQELAYKKQRLKDWLLKNLIFVSEEGNLLKFDDVLVIHPPYGVNQCTCSNQIVLGKVQALIKKLSCQSQQS